MFKCFDSQARREIIILDTEWTGDRLNQLRSHGHSASLLCPECKQPVLVKAGEVKAWHFAHKDLGSCPLQSESPAVLKARSLLYQWLLGKYQRDDKPLGERAIITVEKKLSDDLPRPVDCYVEFPNGQKIAYWVFDRGMRDRALLIQGCQGVRLHPVFLTDMLRMVDGRQGSFDLTTTEREFLTTPSEYSKIYSSSGGSLHYLNKDTGHLTTLRGVLLEHGPKRYMSNFVLEHPLSRILTNTLGEFIHPGEHDRLQEFNRQEEEKQKLIAAAKARSSAPVATVPLPQKTQQSPPDQNAQPPDTLTLRLQKKIPMTCTGCGTETIKWILCKPSEGTCLCRDCGNKLHGNDISPNVPRQV